MTFVSSLEPQALWKYFDQILTIPRGSKEEEKIREYVVGVAQELDLQITVDDVGNVVAKKAGTPGLESARATILQAHLDMVNEKNSDVEHDFSKDPIQPRQDGEYLTASGTTLGSDNGIGVAAMLAIMEAADLTHGPLEFLFTIDEETGLNGAMGLDGSLLDGDQLINLDSEEEGAVTVGCAGGADTTLTLPVTAEASPAGGTSVAFTTGGSRADNVFQALKRIEDQIKRGLARKKTIIVKPNMVVVSRQLSATHVDCLEAILEFLSPMVKDEIIIPESPAGGTATEGFSNYGYLRLAKKYRSQQRSFL